jgi:hypothetical protein
MRTPDDALAWLERQRASGSTAWHNMCESLQRQAYGLPAHFSSAELHANAVPAAFRHGRETPRRGDLILYRNGGYGHIVTATGNGWECYTNDYGGRGRVTLADARNLASWCHATDWYVADAWWSSSNHIRTHEGEDMALSSEDVKKVADAVWSVKRDTYPDRSTYGLLVDSKRAAEKAAAQESGGAPGGPPVLSDADVDRIAARTADVLSARLRA